ncbi:hypothetical protein HYW30_01100, partial [Candidatus Azambacteria bacterium]|nr:hypothetical protein [Candidatus Azambacteria bacterium]
MTTDITGFRALNNLAGISPTLDALAVFFAQTAGPILVGAVALWLIVRLLKKESWQSVGKSALYLFAAAVLSRGILTELLRFIF